MASNSSRLCGHKFITEPDDDLTCRICLEVARDPWQHGKCGMLFCKECVGKYGRQKTCPHCRERQPQYFEDNKSKREIRALCVRCDNIERGCKWEGTVGTLDDHVTKMCQFTPVPCPNECKDNKWCNKCIMKKDLEEHLMKECPNREHQCDYCGMKDTFVSITKEHDKICEKKIVSCTNTGCTMTMERGELEVHVADDCEYTEISCKYGSIGCDVKIKRRDFKRRAMRAHEENDKLHLHMAMDTIVKLKKISDELNEMTDELKETTDELKETTDELIETTDELRETADVVEGRSNMKLESDGSMTFKLSHYRKRKNKRETFHSPSFYTSPTGYRMYLEVCPNGDTGDNGISGVGTHVSVFARIQKGKYDEKLKWPIIGRVFIELLNQLEDDNHYEVAVNLTAENNVRPDGNSGTGDPWFIPHSQLSHDPTTNTQYLKDDTLYFRVSVREFGYKPWLECTAAE